MVCQACGSEVTGAEVRFCPKCGAQIAAQPGQQVAAPVPPPQQYAGYQPNPPYPPMVPRVQRHLQTLGTLWCVYGVYRVLSGLVGMFFFRAFAGRRFGWWGGPFGNFGTHGPPWMGFLPVIATIAVVAAAVALFTGWSLLNRKPWGRILAIVLAILALLRFPVGTALGIYTLWVLAPGASGMEYDAIADRS
jgi:hypothetical protein